jgi:hypothetical protein
LYGIRAVLGFLGTGDIGKPLQERKCQ